MHLAHRGWYAQSDCHLALPMLRLTREIDDIQLDNINTIYSSMAPTHDIPVPFTRANPCWSSPGNMMRKPVTEQTEAFIFANLRLAIAPTKQRFRDLASVPIPQWLCIVQCRHTVQSC